MRPLSHAATSTPYDSADIAEGPDDRRTADAAGRDIRPGVRDALRVAWRRDAQADVQQCPLRSVAAALSCDVWLRRCQRGTRVCGAREDSFRVGRCCEAWLSTDAGRWGARVGGGNAVAVRYLLVMWCLVFDDWDGSNGCDHLAMHRCRSLRVVPAAGGVEKASRPCPLRRCMHDMLHAARQTTWNASLVDNHCKSPSGCPPRLSFAKALLEQCTVDAIGQAGVCGEGAVFRQRRQYCRRVLVRSKCACRPIRSRSSGGCMLRRCQLEAMPNTKARSNWRLLLVHCAVKLLLPDV
jgi:hypothetical protein